MSITITDPITINSLITFSKGMIQTAATKITSYTLLSTDYIIRAEGSGITITLPNDGTRVNGRTYNIHNSDTSNNITIDRNGANINGIADDLTLAAGDSVTIYYNDTATAGWFVI